MRAMWLLGVCLSVFEGGCGRIGFDPVRVDAGTDARVDADANAGADADASAGTDAGTDAGADADASAGTDAGTGLPAFGWMVDETNVGLVPLGLDCSQLPVYSGPYEVPSGTVISSQRFTSNVSLYQGNIIIERSCFQPTSAGGGLPFAGTTNYSGSFEPGQGRVIIRDCEFDGSLLPGGLAATVSAFSGIADLQRNYVHDVGGGFHFLNTGTQLDALVEHNYITQMVASPGSVFAMQDFTDFDRADRVAIIRNNRFDLDLSGGTAAVLIQGWAGRIANVTVEGNRLQGTGYNLVLEQSNHGYSNVSSINNRFTATGWGATYFTGAQGWIAWQDNYLYDSALPDRKGAVVDP
jgi:hypothetical protein